MSSGLIEALRRANRTRRVEDSIPLRVAVLGAVMTGALAVAVEGAVSAGVAVAVLLGLPLAYWVSWRRRAADNWHIKIALTIAAIVGLLRFFDQVGRIASLDEVRFPLAALFLWVQVIHSFDLPARKDLHFSLGSSLMLVAVAASVSQDLRLLPLLFVYFGFVTAALVLSYRSELAEDAVGSLRAGGRRAPGRDERRFPWREGLRAAAVTAVAATLLFLVVPRPQSVRTFALPFSLGSGIGSSSLGGIANPGFAGDPSSRANEATYYGFGTNMDLRVRGDLPDDLVMRVRSSAPAMWRALAFDRYDGDSWSAPDEDPPPVAGDPPHLYPSEFRSLGPRAQLVQTFYIEREQPSVLFSGGQPDEVWFEGSFGIDELGSLRTAATLTPGTVYSMVSTRGAAGADELRALPERDLPENLERYLQLPELPERVTRLAQRITAGAASDYDRVKLIEAWLADNYRYDIESPVPPEGQDAVDHFLFETDVGFCEQFASATTVMLRSLGIPARVVVGYTTGSRNPFTGYYEVRASDAHSWVEVWFPRYGWYEFDPTFAVPPAELTLGEVIPLVKIMEAVADRLGDLVGPGARGMLRSFLLVAVLVAVAVGAWIARRKLHRRRRSGAPAPLPGRAGPVGAAFRRLEVSFADAGRARRPSETAAEYLARTVMLASPATRGALASFEQERYGTAPPGPEEARRAVEELQRLAARAPQSPARRRFRLQ